MFQWLAPVYLGWSLGANDAANAFGTAVASRMLRFSTAAALGAVCVILGAVLEGRGGMATVGGLGDFEARAAIVASIAAAFAVTILTLLRLPVSTSQSVVGAILGVGLLEGGLRLEGIPKIAICWVGTPLGAMAAAIALYLLLAPLANRFASRLVTFDLVLRAALVAVGCYAAYALGANNVANVTGVFVGAGILSPSTAAILGGASIGLGIVTYSRPVMMTVGRGIVGLNAYSALVAVLAEGVTVHVYAKVGVPVSTSQALVGAVLGIGILKSVTTIRRRAVIGILAGWIATPILGGACAVGVLLLARLLGA